MIQLCEGSIEIILAKNTINFFVFTQNSNFSFDLPLSEKPGIYFDEYALNRALKLFLNIILNTFICAFHDRNFWILQCLFKR